MIIKNKPVKIMILLQRFWII